MKLNALQIYRLKQVRENMLKHRRLLHDLHNCVGADYYPRESDLDIVDILDNHILTKKLSK